jgi:hypothetical protein
MREPPRKRLINPEQRRALRLLASSPYGATDDVLMLAHGFARRTLAGLVRAELATARRHAIKAGARTINRITITDVGRNALEG